MEPAEAGLPGPPGVRLRDPKSTGSAVVRPSERARAYGETVRREIAAWRTACRRHGIAYHHVLTDLPFGMALRLLAGRSCIRSPPWGSPRRGSHRGYTCSTVRGRPRRGARPSATGCVG